MATKKGPGPLCRNGRKRAFRKTNLVPFFLALLAVIYLCVVVVNGIRGITPQGWASLMVAVLMLGAVQLISLGVIGEYLSRLYIEVKQRPIYHVRRSVGFARATGEAEADRRMLDAFRRTGS